MTDCDSYASWVTVDCTAKAGCIPYPLHQHMLMRHGQLGNLVSTHAPLCCRAASGWTICWSMSPPALLSGWCASTTMLRQQQQQRSRTTRCGTAAAAARLLCRRCSWRRSCGRQLGVLLRRRRRIDSWARTGCVCVRWVCRRLCLGGSVAEEQKEAY